MDAPRAFRSYGKIKWTIFVKPSERIKEIISDIHKRSDKKRCRIYPYDVEQIKWIALNTFLDEQHELSGAKQKHRGGFISHGNKGELNGISRSRNADVIYFD